MKALIQILLFCLIMTQLQAQSQQQDYTALRALYLNTDGDNWTDNTSWPNSTFFLMNPSMPAGTDVGTWYGVTTDASGFVYCIDMDGEDNCGWQADNGNNLTGSLPPEIDQLMNLEELRLKDNNLSGSILPEIGNLSKLRRLDLVRNEISGEIPVEILNLSNLTHLYLGANQLTGSIFPEFSTLSNLTHLNLAYNYLSGSIPPELGQLSNLENLWLSDNPLGGSIPPELGQLNSLRELALQDNQLTGSIPSELGDLSSLVKLYLSNNQLTGSIPIELGDLSNLEALSLHTNSLSGSIPPEIGDLSALTFLEINHNLLEGCYPENLSALCTQFNPLYFEGNADISDGNNFDAPWEDFCATSDGVCEENCGNNSTMLTVEDADIYVDNVCRGIILTSPNGNCFRLRMNDDGTILTEPVSCP